jgi:O-antigen biosynthesis protein
MERLDPNFTQGRWRLDHLVRYHWAANFASSARVLDAATGCGYGAALLKQAGATEVLGLDRAADAIGWAREKYSGPGIQFEQADLLAGDRAALGAFDLIVSFETLEHLAEPESCVRRFAALLAPGGRLLCSVPSEFYRDNHNPYHLTQFDRTSFEEMLRRHFGSVVLFEQRFSLGSEIMMSGSASVPVVRPCESRVTITGTTAGGPAVPDCYLACCSVEPESILEQAGVVSLNSTADWRADEEEVRASAARLEADAARIFDEANRAIEAAQGDAVRWRNECERITAEWEQARRDATAGWAEASRLSESWATQQVMLQDAQDGLRRAQEDATRWREEAQRLASVWDEQRRQLDEQDRLLNAFGSTAGGSKASRHLPAAGGSSDAAEALRWRQLAERQTLVLQQTQALLRAANEKAEQLAAQEQKWRVEFEQLSAVKTSRGEHAPDSPSAPRPEQKRDQRTPTI